MASRENDLIYLIWMFFKSGFRGDLKRLRRILRTSNPLFLIFQN